MVEIAVRFFKSLAMTRKCASCHYEQRCDEAIKAFSTVPLPLFFSAQQGFLEDGAFRQSKLEIVLVQFGR